MIANDNRHPAHFAGIVLILFLFVLILAASVVGFVVGRYT